MPQDSSIDHGPGGTAFVGPDAMLLFKAAQLAGFLRLYQRTGMVPTRGVTATRMLQLATEITKKPYKRGEYLKAADDLKVWCDTMKAAIPTTVNGKLV